MKNYPIDTTENPHNISKIVLILENSEQLEFTPEQVKRMSIHNIRHNKHFRSFDNGKQSVISSFTALGLTMVFRDLTPESERILRELSNVSQLHIYYESGRHQWYYVAWRDEPDNEYNNQYQEFYPDSNGNYVLKIKPPIKVFPRQIAC